MRTLALTLLICVGAGVRAAADNKGSCPPTPPKPKPVAAPSAPRTPPTPDAQFAGTVTVMAVISDKGCVCDAQVIRRADKETDKKAELAVRRWRFQPAQKDGHNLPVVVTVKWTTGVRMESLFSFPPHRPSCRRKTGRDIRGGWSCLGPTFSASSSLAAHSRSSPPPAPCPLAACASRSASL